jgi:hypothetical protein
MCLILEYAERSDLQTLCEKQLETIGNPFEED